MYDFKGCIWLTVSSSIVALLVQAFNRVGMAAGANVTRSILLDRLQFEDPWVSSPILCASASGNAADNPKGPMALDALQRARSAMFTFDGVSTFDVRHSLDTCCSSAKSRVAYKCVERAVRYRVRSA